ncbi:16S rRNA (guanine966-N2)-methyltransferase [Desulfovibrionales bacterium]
MAKVRQAIFSMLVSRNVDWESSSVLDLYAGSGSLGLEALRRGAALVWFVELARPAAQTIRKNLTALAVSASKARVLEQDVFGLLRNSPDRLASHGCPNGFDVVFVDPPYREGLLVPTLRVLLDNGWLAADGLLLVEIESRLDISDPIDHRLSISVNRLYGQTRILLWWHSPVSPSIPAHLIL